MKEKTIEELARKEKARIKRSLAFFNVPQKKIDFLMPVIENTAFMKVKLDASRELIQNSQIAISYDNGGGQKGIRENPVFKGYESLWKSYMTGMNQLLSMIPEEQEKEAEEMVDKPKTVLELVREKHRMEA